jgi:AcrR family transcriptional regulator
MKKPEKPEPGSRTSLSRELVLRTALDLIDAGGLEALSMRQLGTKLGVEAMSLYNHVAGKDDIIDGVLDRVVEEIAIPAVGGDWRAAMKERAASAMAAFRRHPWASALMDSHLSSSPSRLRYFDAILGTLLGAGFSLELAARAFSILDCYVYGFGRQRLNMVSSGEPQSEKRAEAFSENIPDQSYPHLARMTEFAMRTGYDEDADFDFGIELILDGLERLAGGRQGSC